MPFTGSGTAAPQPYAIAVAKGDVVGVSTLSKFGYNSDIDTTSDPEDIWTQGGVYVHPTAARVHDLVSTSANDDGDPGGTGAQTVTVYGLDASWAEASETVTLDGTTPVSTSGSYIRLNRMVVATAGSGGGNAGVITATAQTDSTVSAAIPVGDGQTGMAIWTVPNGKTLFVTSVTATMAKASGPTGTTDMVLLARPNADTATAPVQSKHFWGVDDSSGPLPIVFDPPLMFSGKTDVWIRAKEVSASNTSIQAWFTGYVVTD